MEKIGPRLKTLKHIARIFREAREELALAGARDAGIPLRIGRLEVDIAADHLQTMEEEAHLARGREPYGLISAILPYDAPCPMLARFGGAALLGGNRLRLSFSSQTPETARLMADILGPIHGLEFVLGMDNRDFGAAQVADPKVRLFFISGAGAVGEAYAGSIASFEKVIFAGPGGLPVALVLDETRLEGAKDFIPKRAFLNGGQYCTTIKKLIVVKEHFRAMRDAVLDYAASLKTGDPLDHDTDIGPIKVERTRLVMEDALKKIAGRVLRGEIRGEWVTPHIIEAQGSVPDLEGFGPLLVLLEAEDRDQALRLALDTSYGFLAVAFGNVTKEEEAALKRAFGMVHLNPDFLFTPLRLPFGGKGKSGWMLERGKTRLIKRDGAVMYLAELTRDR